MKILLLSFTTLVLFVGCGNRHPEKIIHNEETAPISYVENDDPEMNGAMALARKTMPEFTKAFRSADPNNKDFSIKVKFGDDKSGEHIWVGDLQYTPAGYTGVIANVPEATPGLSMGDTVQIEPGNISDWMYLDNKHKLYGSYTTRVLLKRMSPEERKQFDEQTGWVIE